MTNSRHNFVSFNACRDVVQVGNNETIPSYRYGHIKFWSAVCGVCHCITLKIVLFTLNIMYNLISLSQVQRNCFRTYIDDDKCKPGIGLSEILHKLSGKIILIGLDTNEGLFKVEHHVKTV